MPRSSAPKGFEVFKASQVNQMQTKQVESIKCKQDLFICFPAPNFLCEDMYYMDTKFFFINVGWLILFYWFIVLTSKHFNHSMVFVFIFTCFGSDAQEISLVLYKCVCRKQNLYIQDSINLYKTIVHFTVFYFVICLLAPQPIKLKNNDLWLKSNLKIWKYLSSSNKFKWKECLLLQWRKIIMI